MTLLLGLVLISFLVTSFLLVPFIDLLFFWKRRQHLISQVSTTPIHDQILKGKDLTTPVGGGILVILVVGALSLIYALTFKISNPAELAILLFTLFSFAAVGFLDDVKKMFTKFSGKYVGIRARYLLLLHIIFSLISAYLIYSQIGLNNIYIPVVGNVVVGFWYVILAAFVIVSFANAYNISDGLDGLSSGLLVICLTAFLVLAHSVFDTTLSIFVGLWIGGLIAYLYFNVFPARIYLGDAGSFGFGATLAVVGLLSGKIIALGVIGGVYVIIVASSLLQIIYRRFLHKKLLPVAPIHMYFKYIGWQEPKVVFRFWLAGAMFAIFGLWLALLSH